MVERSSLAAAAKEPDFHTIPADTLASTTTAAKVLVHVIVLTEVQGPAPEGRADASHLCGNPWCFEPKHLWWENRVNNIARRGCAGRVLAGDRWIRVCQHTPECKVTTSGVVCDEDDIPSP